MKKEVLPKKINSIFDYLTPAPIINEEEIIKLHVKKKSKKSKHLAEKQGK